MEDLTSLMQLIDLNSNVIPEGSYLEMCSKMKNIYGRLNKPELPETRRNENVPFQPRELTERQRIVRQMRIVLREISKVEKKLKKVQPWIKMSELRKREAIREYATNLGIVLRGPATVENITNRGYPIRNEKQFFNSFLERRNILVRVERLDLEMDLQSYKEEYDRLQEDLNMLDNDDVLM